MKASHQKSSQEIRDGITVSPKTLKEVKSNKETKRYTEELHIKVDDEITKPRE